MAIQLMLPEHMEPANLRDELLKLEPELEIGIGHETGDAARVKFAVIWKHPHGSLKKFPNLKTICVYGHGVDSALLDPDLPEGVPLVRLTDETMANWMSEYLLTVVLMHRRDMLTHVRDPGSIPWGKTVRLPGNRVGILGLGYLGQHAAGLFTKNGFKVLGWSRTPKSLAEIQTFSGPEGLSEMLAESDFLICLLPLTPETESLICLKTLRQMKPGGYLINVGRGEHLVEEDLLRVLDEGHLSGACLDVFQTEPLPVDHLFRTHRKILVTPHNSSSPPAHSVAPQILDNYHRMESDSPLVNQVNIERGY